MRLPHVVYIVGPGERNEELRYSLRSLVNVPHDGVTIAGHKPGWVRNVQYLPVRQSRGKQPNIRANIRAACAEYDQWLLMWDDVFVTRPVDQVPVMHRGPVAALVDRFRAKGPLSSYVQHIERAGKILEAAGYDEPFAYDCIHVPQHIHSEHMLAAIDWAEAEECNAVLTLHGNLAGRRGEQAPNAKAEAGWSRRPFVSTSDRRWRRGVGDYIRDLFPARSEHE